MLNLKTKIWTSENGTQEKLYRIDINHLVNIKKMLRDILDGNRRNPWSSTSGQLKIAYMWICKEINRREKVVETAKNPWNTASVKVAPVKASPVNNAPVKATPVKPYTGYVVMSVSSFVDLKNKLQICKEYIDNIQNFLSSVETGR